MNTAELLATVIDALEDIKAQSIEVFDTSTLTSLFERVIVCTGTSNRQTRSLANNVREKIKAQLGEAVGVRAHGSVGPGRCEGIAARPKRCRHPRQHMPPDIRLAKRHGIQRQAQIPTRNPRPHKLARLLIMKHLMRRLQLMWMNIVAVVMVVV